MPPILKTWPNKKGDLSLVEEGNLVIFCYIDTIDLVCICLSYVKGPSLPWSYISWIYNYLCNKCLSPLMLCVRISIRAKCTTLCMCCSALLAESPASYTLTSLGIRHSSAVNFTLYFCVQNGGKKWKEEIQSF